MEVHIDTPAPDCGPRRGASRTSRIALTGATGFTGEALARRLLALGYTVRALVRPGSRSTLLGGRFELCRGDLGDRDALATLVEGADSVVHIAALFRSDGPREAFFAVNQRGTESLLDSASRAGVRRFVHCSTIGVHGDLDHSPGDEESPLKPRDVYQCSKLAAEVACQKAMIRGDMEIVIVRPCGIYGPGDLRMLKLFRMLARGTFLMIGNGQANFHPVYIDDLVDAFLAALEVPEAAGQAFIAGGPRFMPLREYVAAAADAVGVRPPQLSIPYPLAEAAAVACEAVCRPCGVEPPLHRRRLRFFKHNRAFCLDKARRVLGYAPRIDIERGFRQTVAWYRAHGLLPTPSAELATARRKHGD